MSVTHRTCSVCQREVDHAIYHSLLFCSWDCEFLDSLRWREKDRLFIQHAFPDVIWQNDTPLAGVSKEIKEAKAIDLFKRKFNIR